MERYHHLFEPNELIEAAFDPRNIDWNCNTISGLLLPVYNAIEQDLFDGNYLGAVTLFLQMLDSMTCHFVVDEHYCNFDDQYFPGFDADTYWGMIKKCIPNMNEDVRNILLSGLDAISKTEASKNYSMPWTERWIREMGG